MSADAPEGVTRRGVLLGGLAALAAAVAQPAQAGGGPKFSFFGGESQSSPFTYSIKQKGEPLFDKMDPEIKEYHTGVVKEARSRLAKTSQYIDDKSWEDVRTEIRRQMQGLRKSQLTLMEALEDDSAAQKAYVEFKKTIEALDGAARQKDAAQSKKYRSSALKALDDWAGKAGVSL